MRAPSLAYGYGVLAIAQVAVGAAAIFARYALTGAEPIAVAASRMAVASAALLAIGMVRRLGKLGRPSIPLDDNLGRQSDSQGLFGDVAVFVGAGVALAVHFSAWIWSLQYVSVAASTLLVATTPVWTAVYDAVVYKRNLSPLAWPALFAGLAGVAAIVMYAKAPPPVAGHEILGATLAIAGAVAIAAYFLLIRSVRSRHGTRAIVTQTYAYAALALIAAAALLHQAPPASSDVPAWGGILAMALVSQLLGHTALNAALRWFSASAVAFTTLIEPVSAALLALLIFGERLGAVAWLGAALVLAAIAVFLREERATPQA